MAATNQSVDELAVTYAALILHDSGVPVTADAIATVVKAAGVTIQPFWPGLFERVLKEKDLDDIILSAGAAGGSAPAAGGAAAAGEEAPAAVEEEEEEEEESEDMGFDLFG
eukprot:TRINITY_DN54_c0_g3_i2.p2 TRINITY_DN54_c0_g3~~TRINITY_DN54_c0_g3_i2.p2  ORF type:complete len:111 (+),score=58.90 TRINITY_DN54_c0_g3_i2:51-383(+)